MARRAQAVRVRIVNGMTPKARREAFMEKVWDALRVVGAIIAMIACFAILVLFLALDPTIPVQHP